VNQVIKAKNINPMTLITRIRQSWLAWIGALGILTFNFSAVNAAGLTSASVSLGDPRPSASSSYTLTASGVTSGTIKCIKEVFSTSPNSVSNIGNGFTAASATVTAASSTYINSSATGWTLVPTANSITYTNASGIIPSTTSGATFVLAGVTNSSVANTTYYMQFNTYDNVDCATSPVDSVVVAFTFVNGSTLSLTVDPVLSFTVNAVASGEACNSGALTSTAASTATTIPFGSVTSAANGLVCQDLTAATNSGNGYTVYARYTAKPTSGANTINDVQNSGTNTSPQAFTSAGTEGYGYTTNDFVLNTANGSANRFSTNLWAAMTTANAEVSYSSIGVSSKTARVGHQVGISGLTKPGTYNTTVIYTCTPVY
jgi:hypothetical protein